MRIVTFVLAVPLLIGVKSVGTDTADSNRLLLFRICSTCIQPCVFGNPMSHETMWSSGTALGPPHGCDEGCDCGCHASCASFSAAEQGFIKDVFLAVDDGDSKGLLVALRQLRHKANVNLERGVLQFEGCKGTVAAQLPLSSDLIRFAEAALDD